MNESEAQKKSEKENKWNRLVQTERNRSLLAVLAGVLAVGIPLAVFSHHAGYGSLVFGMILVALAGVGGVWIRTSRMRREGPSYQTDERLALLRSKAEKTALIVFFGATQSMLFCALLYFIISGARSIEISSQTLLWLFLGLNYAFFLTLLALRKRYTRSEE